MILQSAVSLLPPALVAAGMLAYARKAAFDKATTLLMLLALALYYFHFYHTGWTQFTVDPQPHMEYIRFIVDTHRLPLPTDNMGAAARHPPAFYLSAAAMLKAAYFFGLSDPEQFVRHLAMACYAVFIVMGIGIARLLAPTTSMAYYSALLMLLFWPIGVTMGGRISCDILLFAGQAGSLYALMRWQAERAPARLCAPFVWGGIAVLGKNSGAIMIGFAAYALLRTLYNYSFSPSRKNGFRNGRAFLRADLCVSILFAIACTALSLWHGWILRHIEAYGYYWDFLRAMTDHFNPFLLLYDTGLGLSQGSFWNMWLHSLLLGDGTMRWNYPSIMLAINVIWLALLVYAAEGLIAARATLTPLEKSALQLLAVFVLLMVLAALYLLLRTANPNYADARYAYPAILAFTAMHGIAMKHHLEAGRAASYRIGSYLSLTFAVLTLALFGMQYGV